MPLTTDQRARIRELAAQGISNREIAAQLGLSVNQVQGSFSGRAAHGAKVPTLADRMRPVVPRPRPLTSEQRDVAGGYASEGMGAARIAETLGVQEAAVVAALGSLAFFGQGHLPKPVTRVTEEAAEAVGEQQRTFHRRAHEEAGCLCPARPWCVPHVWTGHLNDKGARAMCADHDHVDHAPEPVDPVAVHEARAMAVVAADLDAASPQEEFGERHPSETAQGPYHAHDWLADRQRHVEAGCPCPEKPRCIPHGWVGAPSNPTPTICSGHGHGVLDEPAPVTETVEAPGGGYAFSMHEPVPADREMAAALDAVPSGAIPIHVNDGSAHERAMAWSEGHTQGYREGEAAGHDKGWEAAMAFRAERHAAEGHASPTVDVAGAYGLGYRLGWMACALAQVREWPGNYLSDDDAKHMKAIARIASAPPEPPQWPGGAA